ncbi:MAG: DHA2 family efflux MFS transporter permease subunit [Candidatus Dormibacteraceae bacterium]
MSRLRNSPWAVLFVLCMGFFMVLLDLTIVNIAIPSMIRDLSAGLDQILWVVNAYTLTYAVLLITASRLGDRFGQRNLFVIGLVVFTLSSAACGLSQTPGELIGFRVAQAIGGALLTPQTTALIMTIFPPQARGAAFGVWGAIAGIAATVGPILGGLLVTYIDWRWIFYVNVPIGAVAIVLSLLVIPNRRSERYSPLAIVSVLLASAGLFCICFGLIQGQSYEWGTFAHVAGIPLTIPESLVAGVLLLVAFFLWDARQPSPLVPHELLRNRNFSITSAMASLLNFAMIGMFLPYTIFLQSALGFSAIKAGLVLLPMSLASMATAPLAGRLADRVGGKYLTMAGMFGFALGMAIIDWEASTSTDFLTVLPGAVVAGLGMGFTFSPLVTTAMRDVPRPLSGAASGLYNTIRQLGGAMGGAVVGAVLEVRLSASLHAQAATQSTALPAAFRESFVKAFTNAGSGVLQAGAPSGVANAHLPPEVLAQVAKLGQRVFELGYIDAMRPTILVPIAALLLGALAALALRRLPSTTAGAGQTAAPEAEEPVAVAE